MFLIDIQTDQGQGVSEPNNATIAYSDFNSLSLPQKTELPRGVTMETTYSPIGKTLTRTVHGLGPNRVETYGYDGMQRLTSLHRSIGIDAEDFDVFGFMKETRREYSLPDAPSGLATLTFAIKQTPDAVGNVKTQTYPDNSVSPHTPARRHEPADRPRPCGG
jgi:hypothetical protein